MARGRMLTPAAVKAAIDWEIAETEAAIARIDAALAELDEESDEID